MSYQLSTLPNGLRVASERLDGLETAAIAISVDVGARYEHATQHGISHLLEHMAFKGTKTRSAFDIAQTFDSIGGHLNAFTSHEHTVYYAKVLKEHLPLAVEVLSDILLNSVFDDGELEREKHVILQELAMHHDTPDDLVFDQFQEIAFKNQALGRSILGTASMIQSHPSSAIRNFVAQHYHPGRMVVSAAGNVDHAALMQLVTTHLTLPNSTASLTMEPASYVGGDQIVGKDLEQLQLVIGMEGIRISDPRYYALQVLSILLGGGMSSRLFQEVREKRGLVYSIQSFVASYADTGIFAVYAATGEEEATELVQVVCEQLLACCDSVSEEELQRAKQQQKASLLMARESTSTVAEWMGRHLLQFGEYRHAADLSARIDAVNIADVQALSQALFVKPKVSVAALGPTRLVTRADAITQKLAA